ncbi:MAG: DUF2723 domain-containing protein [Ardenticatenaceae bacterium]|nr:DUF2723 domain-containing protein [Ardenticatenaceae bacterium]MCB9442613.1 DUF2723 domain-containing protein [Ardenticatenaceae bacterium]
MMNATAVSRITYQVSRFVMLFVGILAAARILYELFFPRLLWLGRPFPTITLSILTTLALTWAFTRLPLHPFTLSPLLLNLIYLFNPTVNLVESRLVFAASVWVTAVIFTHANADKTGGSEDDSAKTTHFPSVSPLRDILLLLVALVPVYALTMPATVGRADTFEFQVVAPQLGIAHPTGYPLYLLLGKLFTLVPVGSVAWRLNVGTAVFALSTAILLYLTGRKLLNRPLPALLGAIALGISPTFWSQAIEAEVYSLHALIIAAALYLMQVASGKWPMASKLFTIRHSPFTIHYSLFFLIGLGLANHLTTVFLIPPAILAIFFAFRIHHSSFRLQHLLKMALAFILPLALYAYLPIRWAAVNGEAMGYGRFLQWVTGGRFQGALQWRAWLADPTRYEIVGRLFLENWGWINLAIALIGLIYLFAKQWRMTLILLVTWLGYTFYNLNYYVPDLSVFLIPAQIVIAVWWMAGITAVLKVDDWLIKIKDWQAAFNLQSLIITLLIIPILLPAVQHWPQIDRSQNDGLTEWGQGVLAMPLDENAAILADSEKIAPLYYLQQAEGIRPDLDILVLPDEATYRAELGSRIAAGQTVYLARFLPGLEGIYHLRSVGPLTEVSTEPLTKLPDTAVPTQLNFGSIQLISYELEPMAAVDGGSTAVTFYWQTSNQQPATNNQLVYIRWAGRTSFTSQHPANNYYPTLAWDPGEIVPDYHLLAHPLSSQEQQLAIQVALAPPFTPAGALDWQTVAAMSLPPTEKMELERPYRAQIGETVLSGANFPSQIRPKTDLTVQLTGWGQDTHYLKLRLRPITEQDDEKRPLDWIFPVELNPFILNLPLNTDLPTGKYEVFASYPKFPSRCGEAGGECIMPASYCGWLQSPSGGCVLGEVEISGVPLPDGATNFDDKIALLNIGLSQTELQPGGQFSVTLAWQSLASISEDYTVFIQILDANDRIVGQVDAWPLQGTLATSQWTPGQTITDPYHIWLDDDLPSGQYRLIVGWYLLADLRRLPVLDENGQPIDDKLLVPGLVVP